MNRNHFFAVFILFCTITCQGALNVPNNYSVAHVELATQSSAQPQVHLPSILKKKAVQVTGFVKRTAAALKTKLAAKVAEKNWTGAGLILALVLIVFFVIIIFFVVFVLILGALI